MIHNQPFFMVWLVGEEIDTPCKDRPFNLLSWICSLNCLIVHFPEHSTGSWHVAVSKQLPLCCYVLF